MSKRRGQREKGGKRRKEGERGGERGRKGEKEGERGRKFFFEEKSVGFFFGFWLNGKKTYSPR